MTKWRSTRLNETYAFLRVTENAQRGGSDGSITAAIQAGVNGLTPGQRDRLSDAMEQGAYANAAPGITDWGAARAQADQRRATEKEERAYRRCLIMVMTVRSLKPFDAALQEAANIANQLSAGANPIFQLQARLEHELTNTTARIVGVKNQIGQLNWTGWDRTKYRPLKPGAAIGQRGQPGPGTLGCFVERNGEIFILSNYHVLRQDNGGDNEIIQPAHMVGGSYLDVVADYVDGETTLDAAIARVRRGIDVDNTLTRSAHRISGSATVAQGQMVLKCGCSTGLRWGEVADAHAFATPARNLHGIGITQHQIKIRREDDVDLITDVDFQVQGDSGTVILDPNSGNVLGLLNVKHPTDGTALATLIGPILQRFNVTVLPPGVKTAPGQLGNLINFRTRSITPLAGAGIRHDVTWDSSTGDRNDLAHILVREHVSWPAPPANALPYIIDPQPLEDYRRASEHFGHGNAATTPGTNDFSRDDHSAVGLFKPNFTTYAGPGDLVVTFNQVYEMKVGNGPWTAIPGAAYTLERRLIPLPGGHVRLRFTKTNVANGVDSLTNSQDF